MPTKEIILMKRYDGSISNHGHPIRSVTECTTATQRAIDDDSDSDSDEELGDLIYQSSRFAKANAEAAKRAASKLPAAARKSEHSACHDQTSRVTQGMAIANKSSVIAIIPDFSKNCDDPYKKQDISWDKGKLLVEKDNVHVPPKRVHKRCSFADCANCAQNGGVCIRHDEKVKTCSHEGCTERGVQIGGVCIRHLTYEGCRNIVQKGGVCANQLPLSNTVVNVLSAKTAAANKTNTSPSISNVRRIRNKKRKTRVLDKSCAVKPTDNDILFGRGRFTNTHPGNTYFRRKALEMLPQYKQSCKEEKQNITTLLIETVKCEGHRFLDKGESGLWYVVVDGIFSKASQTFRDLYKHSE